MVHCKIDSGMGRMGCLPNALPSLLKALQVRCFYLLAVVNGSVGTRQLERMCWCVILAVSPPPPPAVSLPPQHPCFDVEGVITHFSSADDNEPFTSQQKGVFFDCVSEVRRAGFAPEFSHCGNSGATALGSEFTGNMARTGIALYGGGQFLRTIEGLRPCMQVKGA